MQDIASRAAALAAGFALAAGTMPSAFAAPEAADSSLADSSPIEIVVTAERREENLQKTPLALQVVSARELADAGVVQVRDLGAVVPGLIIGQGGAATQIYIRGVGDFGSTPITNPAVAFNLDGVYVARTQAVEGNLFDISRVEVLKGPQGTLYGRNASGGAINVITNAPSLTAFGGYGEIEAGNYGEVMVDGALNLPLSSQFALRASFQTVSRDGYLSEGGDDDHHQSGRLQALWKTDSVSVLAGVDYTHVGGVGAGYAVLAPAARNNASPWTQASDPLAATYFFAAGAAQGACLPGGFFPTVVNPGKCPPAAPYPSPPFPPGTVGPYTSVFSFPGVATHTDNTFWKVHADITADLGFATLTVIPAYQSAAMAYDTALAAFIATEGPDDSKAESLEARLSNSSGPVTWVGGLYYFHQNQDSSEVIDGGLSQNNNPLTNQSTRSEAAFGELNFSVTDKTRLIAGARYTSDRRTIDGSIFALPPSVSFLPASPAGIACFAGLPNPCLLESYAGEKTFSKFTWKAGIEADLTPQNLLFATVSTGFKAGGFDQSAGFTAGSHEALSYDPENLMAFELGSRNRFLDNRLQFNAEAFYWKYKDHQEPRLTEDGLGVLSFDYENAGNATLYGLDLDLIARPTDADTVHASVEYLHSVYDTFAYDVPVNTTGAPFARGAGNGFTSFDPVTANAASTTCAVTPITTGSLAGGEHVDCAGNPLTHAPRWSGSAGYEHRFGLPHDYGLTAAVNAQFASHRYLATDFLPAELAPGYISADAFLTLAPRANSWSVQVFCRNLSNRAIYTGAYEGPLAGYLVANIAAPRTYGARLKVTF